MSAARGDLPGGTVTFLFTDVEGSTRLLDELGPQGYAGAVGAHRRIVREAFARHGGVEVDTQGDSFFVAFPTAPGALAAVDEMLQGLHSGPIRVRMGLHTGTPLLTEEGYVGPDVNRAARIAACGHGGQVLVSAATASLLGPERLRDLGEHRLKDLAAPERIYQLGEEAFPPLKSLYRTNLPVPATPFVGRREELAELERLLGREDVRLLTVTGPGGAGKTRLALQAAAEASDGFPDGVFWVALAPLRDPALVLPTASRAVGADDGLAEHVADRRMLILLDNLEQVVAAATELTEVLARCPRLTLLVTSRERLRVRGEQVYPLLPLAEEDGVALFVARAKAADPSFAPTAAVTELCARLDELPLALELAAARTTLFSPEQLLARLGQRLDLLTGERDSDPRQQTLRATLEWSHDLLGPGEQRLLAGLSVFAGGCRYDSAEAVAEADPETLGSLLDKSLVRRRDADGGPRFWMLETIREFAAERLREAGDDAAVRQRHAKHYLALAEEAGPNLEGDPKEWLERLDEERDNLRSALDWLAAAGETQSVLRGGAALWRYWVGRGHLSEGRRRLEDALAADASPTQARADTLVAAAALASFGGDIDLQRRRIDEALALYGELGDAGGLARARYGLASVAMAERDWARAKTLLEQSVPELAEVGDEFTALAARRSLAWMHEELGDRRRYRELTEENLALARRLGNRRIEARSLGALGMVALQEGRLDEAAALLGDSLRLDRELEFGIFIAIDLVRFAAVALARGRAEAAAQLIARADVLREELGHELESWAVWEREEALAAVLAAIDREGADAAAARGRDLTLDDAVALALRSAG